VSWSIKAFSLGIPVISGAGNFGSNLVDKDTLIPSMSDSFSFANNISVGAFDVMKDMIAPYSSIGPSRFFGQLLFKPDIIAPTDVYTTQIGGGYDLFSGTSASAPVIAGCVTLIKQAHPDWTVDEIKASLMNNAAVKYNPMNNEPITWLLQGAGLVNVYKAVTTPLLITPSSVLVTSNNLEPITFTVKNVSDTVQKFNLFSDLTLGNLVYGNTNGISVSLSDNQIVLEKGESKTFTVTFSADITKLEDGPYEGLIWLDNGTTRWHVPFIIWNGEYSSHWNSSLSKVSDFHASSNVIDFNSIVKQGISIEFTIRKGTLFHDISYSYLSNFIDKITVDLVDEQNNTLCNIYSGSKLCIGHYKILWQPSYNDVNQLLLHGLSNTQEYRYVLSIYDNDDRLPTQLVIRTVTARNMPDPLPLDVYLQDYLQTSVNPIIVKGKSLSDSSVFINDSEVSTDKNGFFVAKIQLHNGWNTINVVAHRSDGIENIVKKMVYYDSSSIINAPIRVTYIIGFPMMLTKTICYCDFVKDRMSHLNVEPYLKQNHVYVPIRSLVSALYGSTAWDPSKRRVTVSLGYYTVELYAYKPYAVVNGVRYPIDKDNSNVVPEIIKGNLMVPLEFFADIVEADIEEDMFLKTISITYK